MMLWRSASELGQKYATKNYPSQGTPICRLHMAPAENLRKTKPEQETHGTWERTWWWKVLIQIKGSLEARAIRAGAEKLSQRNLWWGCWSRTGFSEGYEPEEGAFATPNTQRQRDTALVSSLFGLLGLSNKSLVFNLKRPPFGKCPSYKTISWIPTTPGVFFWSMLYKAAHSGKQISVSLLFSQLQANKPQSTFRFKPVMFSCRCFNIYLFQLTQHLLLDVCSGSNESVPGYRWVESQLPVLWYKWLLSGKKHASVDLSWRGGLLWLLIHYFLWDSSIPDTTIETRSQLQLQILNIVQLLRDLVSVMLSEMLTCMSCPFCWTNCFSNYFYTFQSVQEHGV